MGNLNVKVLTHSKQKHIFCFISLMEGIVETYLGPGGKVEHNRSCCYYIEGLLKPTRKLNIMTVTMEKTNTNVLLIGSTGFIGKVTLGMLLEREDVNKVYILIRPKITSKQKKNSKEEDKQFNDDIKTRKDELEDDRNSHLNVLERFENLKKNPCLASNACQRAFSEGRVIPIQGDLTLNKLGLSRNDYERMTSSSISHNLVVGDAVGDAVTHIINLAADVGFFNTLSDALERNVDTVMNVCDFANDCKQIVNLVHCSTAYVAPIHSKERVVNGLKEGLYDLSHLFASYGSIETIYKRIKKGITKVEENDLLKAAGYPNTYTFTKCLAELMLAKKCKDYCFPINIVRPSIVSVSLRYPAPGWIDNHSTLHGPMSLYGAGFLHTDLGKVGSALNVVPCDFVANRLIHAAFTTDFPSELEKVRVIHATAGKSNSVQSTTLTDMMEDFWKHKKVMLRTFTRSRLLDIDKSIQMDQQRLQLIKFFLSCIGQKGTAGKLEKIIPLLHKTVEAFDHFISFTYNFPSTYSIHNFDPKFDCKNYANLICQGVHYYLLKRSEKSLENPPPVFAMTTRSSIDRDNFQNTFVKEFAFRNITFTVGNGKKEKTDLHRISHRIKCGTMVALLGPAAAEKVRSPLAPAFFTQRSIF